MKTVTVQIISKVISQVIRAILIGTLPYILIWAMGYSIIYWHFLVVAYLVDACGQLTSAIFVGISKNIQRNANK